MVYLTKRVDFLERALSTVLEDYQIKGLYLIQDRTREDIEDNLAKYSLRDRLIYFLAKRRNFFKEDPEKEDKGL